MTAAQLLLLVLLGTTVLATIALVRALRQDPARRTPCSSVDLFEPRWSDAGAHRWSV